MESLHGLKNLSSEEIDLWREIVMARATAWLLSSQVSVEHITELRQLLLELKRKCEVEMRGTLIPRSIQRAAGLPWANLPESGRRLLVKEFFQYTHLDGQQAEKCLGFGNVAQLLSLAEATCQAAHGASACNK